MLLVIPPFVILILIAVSIKQRSVMSVALALGVTSWPWTARAVRAQTSSLRKRGHVEMARLNGKRAFSIILTEILPYMGSYIIMVFVLQTSQAIIQESAISMLGLGPETHFHWAYFFQRSIIEAIRTGAWWAFIPVTIITLLAFSYLINVGLDEILNPKLRSKS